MSLLLALVGGDVAPSVSSFRKPRTRKTRSWRPYVQLLPDEQLEQDEAQEERSEYLEPNELLLSAYRERQAAIAARVQALKIEEANARAQEAIAEAARDVAKVRRSAERQVALQLEMQRIAQEIEEMDVAYIVALMD